MKTKTSTGCYGYIYYCNECHHVTHPSSFNFGGHPNICQRCGGPLKKRIGRAIRTYVKRWWSSWEENSIKWEFREDRDNE